MNSTRTLKERKKTNEAFDPCCFFCVLEETDPSVRKAGLELCFKEMHTKDDKEIVIVLSFIWDIAMAQPDDPEFPSLGIFECMGRLIQKGINDENWLMKHHNIYIPYYAAHVIGSYTMKKVELAATAVESGVVPPLMELLRGKMSWVEQRVAVRALGHLASYERTFDAVAAYEGEVVRLAMKLASTCLHVVYNEFVGVKDREKRVRYHRNLLTRGAGGIEIEDGKAEEWASQLQCWSLHLLNCFACKGRSLNLICNKNFLKDLSKMWGGLVNHTSPSGIGLIRILCYSKQGRGYISDSREVILSLCNLSRSSDDWQYMGIDCLLLLLKDQDTRYKVFEIVLFYLVDLVELKTLNDRTNLGDAITRILLSDYTPRKAATFNHKIQKALKEIWDLKAERRKREKTWVVCDEKVEEKTVLVGLIKQQANHIFRLGDVEGAITCYNEAIEICPLKLRKERMVLYSNRAECYLMLGDPDAAIRDTTRALCLSKPANSHGKSLWRRSRAYDMKGLAKESLMDCITFVNGCIKSDKTKSIPYYAAQMISKQMDATWLFAGARRKALVDIKQVFSGDNDSGSGSDSSNDDEWCDEMILRMTKEKRRFLTGLSTIKEEPGMIKEGINSRMIKMKKAPLARSM